MATLRLRPSLREKKRYVAFRVLSESPFSFSEVSRSIMESFKELCGDLGVAMAGPIVVRNVFDDKAQKGIVKVSNTWVDYLRASFAMITRISDKPATLYALGTSGILNKAREYLE